MKQSGFRIPTPQLPRMRISARSFVVYNVVSMLWRCCERLYWREESSRSDPRPVFTCVDHGAAPHAIAVVTAIAAVTVLLPPSGLSGGAARASLIATSTTINTSFGTAVSFGAAVSFRTGVSFGADRMAIELRWRSWLPYNGMHLHRHLLHRPSDGFGDSQQRVQFLFWTHLHHHPLLGHVDWRGRLQLRWTYVDLL